MSALAALEKIRVSVESYRADGTQIGVPVEELFEAVLFLDELLKRIHPDYYDVLYERSDAPEAGDFIAENEAVMARVARWPRWMRGQR